MSQSHSSHTRKRKQSSKADAANSSKKIRLDGPDTSPLTKDKGKSRDVFGSEFKVVNTALTMSVPPVFSNNPRSGVEEMLDSMIMRYIPALQGIVLSHSNLEFTDSTATIKGDCPFLICKVRFDATVWSPQLRMTLVGKISLASPDHISLLVHRTFNVSIPRHHIVTDTWEFHYGPAENDPEFGQDITSNNEASEEPAGKSEDPHGGKWVHKLTGEPLGGVERLLSFTVIGLTVANEMISLIGSLQDDPFSSRHVETMASGTAHTSAYADEEITSIQEAHLAVVPEEEDAEEDTFQQLGRKADEAEEAKRRADEEVEKEATKTWKQKSKKKLGNAPLPARKAKQKEKA